MKKQNTNKEEENCRDCQLVRDMKVPICNYHQGIRAGQKSERERILKLIEKWADEDNGYPEISKGDIKLLKLKLEKID